MSKLRISDAPLLSDVNGSEKIPTGGRGDLAISMEQVKTFAQGGLPQQINAHVNNTENPHSVTKVQVGLGNVDNTSDLDKPVSTAQQEALNLKADKVTTYTKIEVDSRLGLKADKTYVDTNLNLKADKTAVHSKSATLPTYYTKEDGVNSVTGVANGAYFNVRSTDDATMLDEYQNVGGSAVATGKAYPSSMLVQDVRTKAPYFFNTVSAMVSANNISDGMIVGTKGYYNISDNGGAIYLISSASTDYSIPLANGLHAVFRDTFDIRKFGIRNNATLDQTIEFQRLVNYADSRVYEIDFHNFEFMTPKIWTWVATRGVLANQTTPTTNNPSQVMGLPFHYCHKLKNFKIVNDKTTRLNTGHHQIVFAPKQNPAYDQWFEIENATFDPWVGNYQPHSESYLGNYDGMRCGLFCHPARDSTIEQWASTPTNINFRFKNIHFKSPAYSYNLTPSAIFAKRVEAYGLTGEYLATYLNFYAESFDTDVVDVVYRVDLKESTRNIVANAIHFEPELTSKPNVKFDTFSIKRARSKHYTTGDAHWTFKIHVLGTGHTLNKLNFEDVNGMVQVYASVKDDFIIDKFEALSSDSVNLAIGSTVNHLHMQNFGLRTVGQRLLTGGGKVLKITGDNIDFYTPLAIDADAAFTVDEINLTNIRLYENSVGLLRNTSKVSKIVLDGVKTMESNITASVARSGYDYLKINNLSNDAQTGSIVSVIQQRSSAKASTYLSNFNITIPNNLGGAYVVDGATDVNISNSNFVSKPVFQNLGDGVVTKRGVYYNSSEVSKTYDPPSIAASGVVTTTVTAQGVVIGDTVQAAFSQYNADIEISASVSSANTVTVKFRNTGAAPVDLASGTLTVKLI